MFAKHNSHLLLAVLLLAGVAQAFDQASLAGDWSGTFSVFGTPRPINFRVDGAGNIVSGTCNYGSGTTTVAGRLIVGSTGAITGQFDFPTVGFSATASLTSSTPGQNSQPFRMQGTAQWVTMASNETVDVSGGTDPNAPPPPPPPPLPRNLPDLFIKDFTVVTTPAVAGQPLIVMANITNCGDAAAGPFNLAFFRDRAQPGSSLEASATTTVAGLAVGASIIVTGGISYPAPGDFSFSVAIDPDSVLPEQSKANNFAVKRVTILAEGIDLVIKLVSVTESVPGVNVTLKAMVENRGLKAAPGCKLGVFANRPRSVSLGDQPTQVVDLPPIAGLSGALVSCDLPVQAVPRAGRAWLFADCYGTISEDLETNNVASATWGIPNDPPVITSPLLVSPAAPSAGQAVTLTLAAVDPNADELSFVWDFGDGTSSVGSAAAQHTFAVQGRYEVVVIISDGPYHETRQSLLIEVAAPAIDLGSFSLRQTGGKLNLTLPLPTQFNARQRFKSKLIASNSADKMMPRGQHLRGRLQSTGQFSFTVEYLSRKPANSVRVNYTYRVVE